MLSLTGYLSQVEEPVRGATSSHQRRVIDAWNVFLSESERFFGDIRNLPVSPDVSPGEIRSKLERRFTFEKPVPLDSLTAEVCTLLRDGNLHVTHPRYFGLFNPSVRPAAIVADAIVALFNPQLAVWSHAPVANEIEQLTLRHFTELIGYDSGRTLANFTSGGAEANLSAVLSALLHRFPEYGEYGVRGLSSQPVIYLTGESHHSFVKVARMTGLGTRSLREIPTDTDYALRVDLLERQIERDRRDGLLPFMVIGTGGTTGAGVVDPLPEIAEVARRQGLWFHVDAAWGGGALCSPRLRGTLRGIEEADSVTWDAHKWLSVPMGAGMFFCRHPGALRRAFAISASYMPGETGDDTVDPYKVTAQWSRRMIGLKVFMALAELGMEGYARMIEAQADLGNQLRRRLEERGWLIKNRTPLPVICFTHPLVERGAITTEQLLNSIYGRRRVWISDVVLGGKERLLRACITSYRTDESDIDCLLEELERALTTQTHPGREDST
jgi:glutamate/tyrosine decarboxylase-like PLP-dependent enzyme